jgi:predicted PurR-regulated permease PerM
MSLKQLSENPLIRMLAVIVMFAAGIRLIFELLEPVWPYLLAGLIAFAVFRVVKWHRERW